MAKFHKLVYIQGVKWIIRKYIRNKQIKFVANADGYESIFSVCCPSNTSLKEHMK